MKLQFGATPSKEVFGYCDADWGDDLEDSVEDCDVDET
jgi:hypothetical protein